jgi:hypothetical protein
MNEVPQFNRILDWKKRGYHLRTPPLILVGYDPAGDGQDRDALTMTAREEHQKGEPYDPDFSVMMLYRCLMAHEMAPDLEFPDKLAMLLRLHRQLKGWARSGRAANHVFTVETNGVGYAMGSALRANIGNNVICYTTVGTSGSDPYTDKKLAMPRLAALDNLRVLAETHSLKLAKDAPGRDALTRQMASFVWRRPGRPEAIEGQHDDLVLSLAGACWIGSKVIPPILKQIPVRVTGMRRH